jgi:transposase
MYWNHGRLQWCWAHLKRDFQALIDHKDRQVQRLGYDLMRCTRRLFRQWSRCRDGDVKYAEAYVQASSERGRLALPMSFLSPRK